MKEVIQMGMVVRCDGYENYMCWTCGGFNHLRERLAFLIGLTFRDMKGCGGDTEWPFDPIIPLLKSRDCDTSLSPTECALVVPRLRELMDEMEFGDCPGYNPNNDDIGRGRHLCHMMAYSVKNNLPLRLE